MNNQTNCHIALKKLEKNMDLSRIHLVAVRSHVRALDGTGFASIFAKIVPWFRHHTSQPASVKPRIFSWDKMCQTIV